METARDSGDRREGCNCRKKGSLARHYPQSNPQFKVRERKGSEAGEMRESDEEGAI